MPIESPTWSDTEEAPTWENTTEPPTWENTAPETRYSYRPTDSEIQSELKRHREATNAPRTHLRPDLSPEDTALVERTMARPPFNEDQFQRRLALEEQKRQAETEGIVPEMLTRIHDPIVPPRIVEQGLKLAAKVTPAGPIMEMLPGVRQAKAEALSSFTSPVNIALMGAGAGGGALARGIAGGFSADMARHVPDAARVAGETSVTGTPQETQKAIADVALQIGMAGFAGGGAAKGAKLPERGLLTKEMAAADNAARAGMNVGLNKSVEALQRTTEEQKGVSDAIQKPTAGESLLREERPEVELPRVEPPRAEIPPAEVPPAIPAEAPRAEAPVKAAQARTQFNTLLQEYGAPLGYIKNLDAVAGIPVKGPQSGASVKAKIAGTQELSRARRAAIKELGGNPDAPDFAALVPKFKERITKYEAEQAAKEAEANVGVEAEIPPGASTEFLPPESVPSVPRLAPGERGTGDLLKTVEEPLKLVGETEVDLARVAAEKEAAEARLAEAKALQEQQQPALIGMGGAIPSEFNRGQGTPTAMKFRQIDAERQQRGLPPVAKPERTTDQAQMDRAMAAIDQDPSLPERLTKELNENPRAIEDWENHVLLLRKIELRHEYEKSARDAAQAFDDGRLDDMTDANARTAEWSDKLSELENASRVSGSARGRALRSLRVMANEDMTLASLELRARADKGGAPITPEERAQLQKLADDYKAKSDALEKSLAESEQRAAQAEIQRALAEARATPSFHPKVLEAAEKFAASWDKKAQDSLAFLKQKFSPKLGITPEPLDPAVFFHAARYGAGKLIRGTVDFGKWSAEMARDIGEGITPYLKDVFDAAQKQLDDGIKAIGGVAAERVRRVVNKTADTAEKIDAAIAGIQTKLEKGTPDDIYFDVQKLVRGFVEQGIKEWRPLTDAVHGILKKIVPEWDYRDTMDAISGHGRFKPLSKDAVSATVRDLKGQLNEIRKIQEVIAKQPVKKTGLERPMPSDLQRRLTQIYNDVKKKFGVVVTDPATQLHSTLQARKTYYENRIKDLQHEIDTRQKTVKSKTPPPTDAALEALKAEHAKLKEEHAKIFPKQPMTEAQRLELLKTRLAARMSEMQDRMARGDFAKKTKREPPALDQEAIRLKADMEAIKSQFDRLSHQWRMAQRTSGQKIVDGIRQTIRASKNIIASFDFSAPRQALPAILSHPIRSATAFRNMFKAWSYESRARVIEQEIKNRPNAKNGLDAQAKIEYSSLDETSFTRAEENARSVLDDWAQLPLRTGSAAKSTVTAPAKLLARGVRMSNRAFITFLNKTRADLFDTLLASNFRDAPPTPAQLQRIGNLVNVMTGRGAIHPKVQSAASAVLWSPKLLASRIQLLAGQPIMRAGLDPKVRNLVAKEYVRMIISGYALWNVAQLFGDKHETDPTSSDFGKIVLGDTRIDPWGGFQQVTVLEERLRQGQIKTLRDETVPIRGEEVPFRGKDAWDIGGRFLRTKLTPGAGTTVDVLVGKNVVGEPTTLGSVIKSLVVPLTFRDLIPIAQEHGFTAAAFLTALNAFGVGVSQYENEKQK